MIPCIDLLMINFFDILLKVRIGAFYSSTTMKNPLALALLNFGMSSVVTQVHAGKHLFWFFYKIYQL